jgi:ubiquinone/menaquinone biosynthesis C-methylase UbiE
MNEMYSCTEHYTGNDYKKPRELFKFIANIIEMGLNDVTDFSILDVGCAKGEFLYYLSKRFSAYKPSLCGVDFSKALIECAKKFHGLDSTELLLDNAETFAIRKKFDIITATGIISFFDDYSPFLENLFRHLKPNGVVIITNGFSTSNYDVYVKFRKFNQKAKTPESGWNQHSINGINDYVSKADKKLITHKFELPFTLSKQDDLLRSWTIETNEGQKFVNGLNQIWNLWSLEIK